MRRRCMESPPPSSNPPLECESVNLVFEFGANVLTVKKASQGELSRDPRKGGIFKKKKKSNYLTWGTGELSFIHVSPIHDSDGPLLVLSTSNTRELSTPTAPSFAFSAHDVLWISSVIAWRGPTTVQFGGKPVTFPPTPLEYQAKKGQAASGVFNFNRQTCRF